MDNPFQLTYLLFYLILLLATIFLIKVVIQNLALKALKENQKSFLDLAEQSFQKLRSSSNEDLESKKTAIEKQLFQLNDELNKLKTNTTELKANLQLSKEQLTNLTDTTNQLNSVLSNNQQRGQWGERQAEDLLGTSIFKRALIITSKRLKVETVPISPFTSQRQTPEYGCKISDSSLSVVLRS